MMNVELAEHTVDKLRAFEPPVAEKLRIVRRDNQRWPAFHQAREILDLPFTVEHKVAGMLIRFRQSRRSMVGLLVFRRSRDLVILDAQMRAVANLVQMRL